VLVSVLGSVVLGRPVMAGLMPFRWLLPGGPGAPLVALFAYRDRVVPGGDVRCRAVMQSRPPVGSEVPEGLINQARAAV
jgi:hypothetical protein